VATLTAMRAPCIAAGLALTVLARPAGACAPAPPPGVQVQIAEESAIVIWDAKAHREDFIRRASFHTTGKDFGFLVPTPEKPELAEVPDSVFDLLEAATKPEVIRHTQVGGMELTFACAALMRGAAQSASAPPVRVVDTQRVAGYDAAVLEADSAGALAAWLQAHGYADRPELAAWLAPYVAARWKITAFKIASDRATQVVETGAVRMSFTTDRPFFPYSEPSDQRANAPASDHDRLLRIFFFGGERVDGSIGAAGSRWPGNTIWSDHFDAGNAGVLPFALPQGAWLTMFEDRASPRPGTDDLFFAPAHDLTPVKPPPLVWTHQEKMKVPVDLIAGSLLVAAFVLRRLRRRMGKRAA
jgi:Uncharacterized protein conserved in bacteria (DUF2330)